MENIIIYDREKIHHICYIPIHSEIGLASSSIPVLVTPKSCKFIASDVGICRCNAPQYGAMAYSTHTHTHTQGKNQTINKTTLTIQHMFTIRKIYTVMLYQEPIPPPQVNVFYFLMAIDFYIIHVNQCYEDDCVRYETLIRALNK